MKGRLLAVLWRGLVFVLAAGVWPAQADPPSAVLDLATVSPADGRVRWVYGATGEGDFGVPVAGGLDCDGDGFRDYAVAYMRADPLFRANAGEVNLVFGDGTTGGFVDTAFVDPRVLRVLGSAPQESAGDEIWIDDVTGDGLGDLLIGRQNFTPDAARIGAGALTIVSGGPGLRDLATAFESLDLADPPPNAPPILSLVGANALDRLGIWMRTGDVTGDGIADIVVGADQEDLPDEPNRGAVYVVRGGPHLAEPGVVDLAAFGATALGGNLAKITPPAGSAGYHFGATCQIADLDGNGRGEVLAAAALFRAGATIPAAGAPPGSAESSGGAPGGAVYVLWDGSFSADWPAGLTIDLAAPAAELTVIRGGASNRALGEELLGGLDYDGDGRPDLFIGDLIGDGSPLGDRAQSGLGYVLYDAASLRGIDFGVDSLPAGVRVTRILGPRSGALGADTAAHGDFDGDGIDDLAVTAPHAAPQDRVSAGAVHLLFGRAGGWPAEVDTVTGGLPPATAVEVVEVHGAAGNSAGDLGDTLGYSAAAADVDGDGRTDLLVNEMLGNGVSPGTVDVGNLLVIGGAALALGEPPCVPGPATLCLVDGRFRVEVAWQDFSGEAGAGQVAVTVEDSGVFWFFEPQNWEMLAKVVDGCAFNDRFWVFSAATTNVQYTLRVTDTRSGTVRRYENPLGAAAAAITDTDAFATCP